MKRYIHKDTFFNLLYLFGGASLFFTSFVVGEATLLGGAMHLSGCAFFCCGVHKKWCKDPCEENKCC